MKIQNLKGKKVCIIGFGREGRAILNALPKCEIVIADKNEKLIIENGKLNKVKLQIGADYLKNLNDCDVIIKSPGVPPSEIKYLDKDKITNSTQIFLDTISDTGSQIIGITGSKGKSTTASLIYKILKNAGKDVYLVGNIGNPAIKYINKAKNKTLFVMEMSSYQLMNMNTSPHIAVITTFFPEHLDYHGSLEAYLQAKKNITKFQTKDDFVFFNIESDKAKEIANNSKGTKIPYSKIDSPIPITKTLLLGTHNLINIAATYKIARHLNINDEIVLQSIKEFKSLPHRLQNLGIYHGITWIDDSISTTPESTIAAIDALEDVSTIILGGQERGNDFSNLCKRIAKSSIKNVILMGENSQRIRKSIEQTNAKIEFIEAQDMQSAINETIRTAQDKNKNLCLLSPASPSYDLFKNFEERGNEFIKQIYKLKS